MKVPLEVKKEGKGNDSEAHLLNSYDSKSNLPEYEPYSLVAYNFKPLALWKKESKTDPKIMYKQIPPFEIMSTKEFKEMADTSHFHTISFEISEYVDTPSGTKNVKQIITVEN